MRVILLVACCALAGCESNPFRHEAQPPAPPQTVNKIVRVPCVDKMPACKDIHTDDALKEMDEGMFVTAIHGDRLKLRECRDMLEAVLEGCLDKRPVYE